MLHAGALCRYFAQARLGKITERTKIQKVLENAAKNFALKKELFCIYKNLPRNKYVLIFGFLLKVVKKQLKLC